MNDLKVSNLGTNPITTAHVITTNDQHKQRKGLSLLTATIFILGELAGGGILSLPHAVSQSGWTGMAVIVFCALCAAVSGLCLAKCWILLEERYPKYRQGLTRKPYATIADHAYGKWASVMVSILLNVTLLGASTVFTLLTAQLMNELTASFIRITYCQWIPIIMGILLTPLWLGSPADFWPIAYSAMISSAVGSVLIIVNILIVLFKEGTAGHYGMKNYEYYASAFGAILFSFGGASAFPTFQNDMKDKLQFPKAVMMGFSGLLLLYLPVAGFGYAAFGYHVDDSIITSLENNPHSSTVICKVIQFCFLIHCGTVVCIVLNPVFLELEELCKIPTKFHWKRCIFRTIIALFILFIGETFPSFGPILNLIGGTTVSMMSFVLPPIFYLKLCNDGKNNLHEWRQHSPKVYEYVFYGVIILIGIVGGITSTYSTLKHWKPLSSACYINSHTDGNNSSFSSSSTTRMIENGTTASLFTIANSL